MIQTYKMKTAQSKTKLIAIAIATLALLTGLFGSVQPAAARECVAWSNPNSCDVEIECSVYTSFGGLGPTTWYCRYWDRVNFRTWTEDGSVPGLLW